MILENNQYVLPPKCGSRVEYWPASDGIHIVQIYADGTVRQIGWLWEK